MNRQLETPFVKMTSNENISPSVVAGVMKELRKIMKNPMEGIRLHINDHDISSIAADIQGPVDTPYEGGSFRVKLSLGPDFPRSPPQGFFLTKIFHPNVAANGEICVNTLKRDWKPEHGFEHVLSIIRCLLIFPNPESALNEEAGHLLMNSYDEYAKRAQIFTKVHATKRTPDDSKSTSSSSPPEDYIHPSRSSASLGVHARSTDIDEHAHRRSSRASAKKRKFTSIVLSNDSSGTEPSSSSQAKRPRKKPKTSKRSLRRL
eukprot:55882_1